MRLTIIQDNCEMLHGGIKDEDRMAAVDRFQTDPSVFVFLISQYPLVVNPAEFTWRLFRRHARWWRRSQFDGCERDL